MDTLIVPACYFGPIELYKAIARADRVIVDTGEHFVRQSYRTQTHLASANGVETLSVRIQRTHEKTPMRQMRLSYAEAWPAQHWHAIRSAYGQSAWFIHYEEAVRSVVLTKHENLVERNMATMQLMLRLCRMDKPLHVEQEYQEPTQGIDLREALHPKKELPAFLQPTPSYRQVFEEKYGFAPRMSILDLLMNMGPETTTILRS